MTDKAIDELITKLNSNTFEFEIFFRAISQNVDYAKTWLREKPHPKIELRQDKVFPFYLIKDESGKYAGAVLDMDYDLHWYIKPDKRKNRLLSKNLKETILPHLSKFKTEQRITINEKAIGSENAISSQNVAKSVGFEYVGEKSLGLKEFSLNLRQLNSLDLEEKDGTISEEELRELQKAIQCSSEIINRVKEKVEITYGRKDENEDYSDFLDLLTFSTKEIQFLMDKVEDVWWKMKK